ncbi:hypothetical protein SLA2020_402570 [Shorea laevis]
MALCNKTMLLSLFFTFFSLSTQQNQNNSLSMSFPLKSVSLHPNTSTALNPSLISQPGRNPKTQDPVVQLQNDVHVFDGSGRFAPHRDTTTDPRDGVGHWQPTLVDSVPQ